MYMHKITRSLTAIGAAAALTLAGTSVATAQTSFPNLSSWLPGPGNPGPGPGPGGPDTNVEQQLHNAAEGWARKSTGKSVALRNNVAQSVNPSGSWDTLAFGVSGAQRITLTPTNQVLNFFRIDKNNRGPIVTWFNTTSEPIANREYGIHVHSDANYYYVNVVFVP